MVAPAQADLGVVGLRVGLGSGSDRLGSRERQCFSKPV